MKKAAFKEIVGYEFYAKINILKTGKVYSIFCGLLMRDNCAPTGPIWRVPYKS